MSAPGDLASLAACKAWLGLSTTSDDAVLAALISAISQAVAADLGRALLPANVIDVLDGHGGRTVMLRQWPATGIDTCTVDGVVLAASPSPSAGGFVLDGGDAAPPGRPASLSLRGGSFPRGIANIAITYRAGYEILGEAALVPNTSPFTVQAAAPFGAWALDTGVDGAPSADYTAANGLYSFSPAEAGAAVSLNYGYVPFDIAQATIEWVADRYAARSRIGQSAKTLGGQETTSFVVKAMPDAVSRLLQPYRRIPG